MNIDKLVTLRLITRILMVVVVFFGLVTLVESLDGWRYTYLSDKQGPGVALLAIFAAAAHWSIKVLPVTVLLGAILALLDLQGHRELVVIKSAGLSVWRIARGPILLLVFLGLGVSLFADAFVTNVNRGILPIPRLTDENIGGPNQIWLAQDGPQGRFVIYGTRIGRGDAVIEKPTFFLPPGPEASRVQAERATLENGKWVLEQAMLFSSNKNARPLATFEVPTNSTQADVELRLTTSDDFGFFELQQILANGLSDPVAQAAAATRYAKLLALPALLVGSLLIAFAFTAGYRRTGSYSSAILGGVVLGFVVFVITEMADRAGSAGVLAPTFAAWGPAVVAIVVGLTVMLYKEDGQG